MYLVWINPPTDFTFSDDSVLLKKILAGDINSLNLLVLSKSEFKQAAASGALSTMMKRLVSSANKRMLEPMSLTMSFMK